MANSTLRFSIKKKCQGKTRSTNSPKGQYLSSEMVTPQILMHRLKTKRFLLKENKTPQDSSVK